MNYILLSILFFGMFEMSSQTNAIIRPNGNYFKYKNRMSLPKIKKIRRAKYWNSYIENLDKSLNEYKDDFLIKWSVKNRTVCKYEK